MTATPKMPSEIAEKGLMVDVPFEGAASDPQPLEYADLGADFKWNEEGESDGE